jgi:hypothetical protein
MLLQNPTKVIILWALLIIAMILHFNYHVGEIFYGIDIKREGADGTIPKGVHIIRNVFYHLPIIWILTLMYFNAKPIRLAFFVVSLVYTLSHCMHLARDIGHANFSQTPLLTLAVVISFILNIEQFKYWKSDF